MNKLLYIGLLATIQVFLGSCNGHTKPESQNLPKVFAENKLVGGGCDGCELMYFGMPQNIHSVDTTAGW